MTNNRMCAAFAFALLLALPTAGAWAACPPAGQTVESLQALKAARFEVADARERSALAQGLLACLGDPDPALRDGIAYEALTHWMRTGGFEAPELRDLRARLQAMLDGDDPQGFRRPFAALVLAEVARTDRVAPWMTPGERAAMVESAASYLESVRDYRGFDAREGWRHGVAHGADWLMQLAQHPALEKPQLQRILAAVATQAVPGTAHAYVFGEPTRLAQPVLHAARRGLFDAEEWRSWLATLQSRLGGRPPVYTDPDWLARRHDLQAFLSALHLDAGQGDDAHLRTLQAQVLAVLRPSR